MKRMIKSAIYQCLLISYLSIFWWIADQYVKISVCQYKKKQYQYVNIKKKQYQYVNIYANQYVNISENVSIYWHTDYRFQIYPAVLTTGVYRRIAARSSSGSMTEFWNVNCCSDNYLTKSKLLRTPRWEKTGTYINSHLYQLALMETPRT